MTLLACTVICKRWLPRRIPRSHWAGDGDLNNSRNCHKANRLAGAPSMVSMRSSSLTPALSADEKTLYVPDYVRGIAAIEPGTRALRWLAPGEGVELSGIDGLYVYGDSFLAVQNGTEPRRIVRFSMDLRKQVVLEANTPALGEPTHGVVIGRRFYFLANTGWDRYDREGRKKDTAAVMSSVRKLDLE
jgi:hypothetical protein